MIEKIVKENGTYNMLLKGSLKKAEKELKDNEKVLFAGGCNSYYQPLNSSVQNNAFSVKNKISGILVVTDKRIYFCNSILGNGSFKEVLLDSITSIDSSKSLGVVSTRICNMTEMFIVEFKSSIADELKKKLSEAMSSSNKDTNNSSSNISVADELKKLKELLDSNVITKEEFENEKNKLLNK